MALVSVKVTPRSSRNKVSVSDEGLIQAWTTAAPTDDQANDAVCRLLADGLRVAKSSISIVRGHKTRQKTIAVEGLQTDEILERLRGSER